MDYKEYARQMRENAVIDDYGRIICSPELWEQLARIIESQPTADVVEVKHGYWFDIDSDVGWELVGCSVCGKEYSICEGEDKTDYCPYCGARMDGRSDI